MIKTRRRFAIGTRLACTVIGYLCFTALTLPVTYADTLQQAYLKASNTSPGDYFGWDLAISGNTAVVGANAAGAGGAALSDAGNHKQSKRFGDGTGAAYVYTRSGTSWSLQATLEVSNAAPGDVFGHSVDISGDTLVVSAPGEDSSATGVNGDLDDNSVTDSGAVYVFTRHATTWSPHA
jgi:hypothetical protein